MIEDDALPATWPLANPVGAITPGQPRPARLRRHRSCCRTAAALTALEVQWELLEQARKYEREHGLEAVGEDVGAEVLRRWEEVLTGLEADRSSVADQVDWVAKERLLDGYRSATAWSGATPGCGRSTCSTTTCGRSESLFARVGPGAADRPTPRSSGPSPSRPTTTRAYFRGKCLQKWPNDIVAANWDSMVFDVGRDPLRRVPMMEPLRGTAGTCG